MSEYTCTFCNKAFTKLGNLNKHQKSAKYCKKLQQEIAEKKATLKCSYCEKVLSRADSLFRHYTSCIEYHIHQRVQGYEKEIDSLKERLAEKETQLQLAQQRLWDLTNTSINKTTTSYTHIDNININGNNETTTVPTVYPLAAMPNSEKDVTTLIDELHSNVNKVFNIPLLEQK